MDESTLMNVTALISFFSGFISVGENYIMINLILKTMFQTLYFSYYVVSKIFHTPHICVCVRVCEIVYLSMLFR